MQISTNFDIGDRVWTVKECKALEFEVCSISISSRSTPSPAIHITYCGAYSDGKITAALESECFASKEALLNHIAGNGEQDM